MCIMFFFLLTNVENNTVHIRAEPFICSLIVYERKQQGMEAALGCKSTQ